MASQVQDEEEAKGPSDTQPKPSVEEYGPWTVVSQRKSTTKSNPQGASRVSGQSDSNRDSRWPKWPSWAHSANTI